MSKTKIEWADTVWNPVTGCTPISPGCENCYAKRMAQRLRGRCGYPADEPFKVTLHPKRLDEPLRWRKPRRVFVCSMGDLFHEEVPFDYIDRIFAVMLACHIWSNMAKHTFMVLTKRPKRMSEYFSAGPKDLLKRWANAGNGWLICDDPDVLFSEVIYSATCRDWDKNGTNSNGSPYKPWGYMDKLWPLPNVWLGVTAENQQKADERIPILLQIPAAVRFVSVEPMLGAVDLTKWLDNTIICDHCGQRFDPSDLSQVFAHITVPHQPIKQAEYSGSKRINGLHWVICGGETGPNARYIHPDWVRYLRDQCQAANVPFFLKQMHINGKIVKMPELDGRRWDELPRF